MANEFIATAEEARQRGLLHNWRPKDLVKAERLRKNEDFIFENMKALAEISPQSDIVEEIENSINDINNRLDNGRVNEANNALKLGGKKLLATVNDDGTFNDDGIFKIKEENGNKFLYGILDTVSIKKDYVKQPLTFDILGDGSCVALYEFEGNANDTGGVYHGTWVGNEQYDVGKIGQAAKFDGSNAIDIHQYDFSNIKSISLFFKISADETWWYTILGSEVKTSDTGNNIKLAVYNKYLVTYHNSQTQYIYNEKLSLNTWYHIVITYTNNDIYNYYLDGTLINSLPDNNSSMNLYFIGSDNNCGNINEVFFGTIDNLRLLNKVLTSDEVQYIYNIEKQGD